ncbi:RNA methyltransferase [Lysinibacillus odysseyi 34hs-1 = NBRC 100172]|uniref:RNA methyltransferase n=1 Tax=Lysinibacillus odysseyi 34hs-1 = NBRC 100172 TaxID=1220589 RepID=A0A0A3ICY9_9BACI|nr:RNA methyltransferase [Lysinibacillus odysseyi 34hs-1 = NBRC 100172]
MKNNRYIYTFVHHPDEYEVCRMEMRAFFGKDTDANYLFSETEIDPSRSPFIEERLTVLYAHKKLDDLKEQLSQLAIGEKTYKVICLNKMDMAANRKIEHNVRQQLEREIGLLLEGEPDLNRPQCLFGIIWLDGVWYFGLYTKSESVWRKHKDKPQQYSTALNTRTARALVNIAVPQIENIKVIDPCCGIGTVLIEALSMGIQIEGRDINWHVCQGSRKNIAHFGLKGTVAKGPISEVVNHYDVAIIDLPYNVFTHASISEQAEILKHARRIADQVLVVTIDPIDRVIEEAGFEIFDRCVAKKQHFSREILLCR